MKTNDIVTISDVCADLLLFGDDIMPEFGQKEKLSRPARARILRSSGAEHRLWTMSGWGTWRLSPTI